MTRPPKGEWTTSCMPAAVVEEALEHDVLLGRHDPQLLEPGRQVGDDLLGRTAGVVASPHVSRT